MSASGKSFGTSTSTPELLSAVAVSVKVTNHALSVDLADGRTISAPISWFPRLTHGTAAERRNWRLIGQGLGVHWNDLDEDVSIEGLLLGRPSVESQESFRRWLEQKKKSRARGKRRKK